MVFWPEKRNDVNPERFQPGSLAAALPPFLPRSMAASNDRHQARPHPAGLAPVLGKVCSHLVCERADHPIDCVTLLIDVPLSPEGPYPRGLEPRSEKRQRVAGIRVHRYPASPAPYRQAKIPIRSSTNVYRVPRNGTPTNTSSACGRGSSLSNVMIFFASLP